MGTWIGPLHFFVFLVKHVDGWMSVWDCCNVVHICVGQTESLMWLPWCGVRCGVILGSRGPVLDFLVWCNMEGLLFIYFFFLPFESVWTTFKSCSMDLISFLLEIVMQYGLVTRSWGSWQFICLTWFPFMKFFLYECAFSPLVCFGCIGFMD